MIVYRSFVLEIPSHNLLGGQRRWFPRDDRLVLLPNRLYRIVRRTLLWHLLRALRRCDHHLLLLLRTVKRLHEDGVFLWPWQHLHHVTLLQPAAREVLTIGHYTGHRVLLRQELLHVAANLRSTRPSHHTAIVPEPFRLFCKVIIWPVLACWGLTDLTRATWVSSTVSRTKLRLELK